MSNRWTSDKDRVGGAVREGASFYEDGRYVGGVVRYTNTRTWSAWVGWKNDPREDFVRRCEAKRWVESEAAKVEA